MPDLVSDLLCLLEQAGAPEAIAIGYAESCGIFDVWLAEDLEDKTGVPNWRMKQRANARTSLRLP